tara:strand:- start:836 stop:1267 length:432 start_codon:yes stop_codon:yes gene_type:complete
MSLFTIKPKIGIGDIKFNASINEFIDFFGNPDEDELLNDENENFKSRILHYDNIGLSASFDEEYEWRLTSIAVSENEFQIKGVHLIGINNSTFLEKIKQLNFGKYEREVFVEDDYSSTLYHFEDMHLSFWFENNELKEIQWGI